MHRLEKAGLCYAWTATIELWTIMCPIALTAKQTCPSTKCFFHLNTNKWSPLSASPTEKLPSKKLSSIKHMVGLSLTPWHLQCEVLGLLGARDMPVPGKRFRMSNHQLQRDWTPNFGPRKQPIAEMRMNNSRSRPSHTQNRASLAALASCKLGLFDGGSNLCDPQRITIPSFRPASNISAHLQYYLGILATSPQQLWVHVNIVCMYSAFTYIDIYIYTYTAHKHIEYVCTFIIHPHSDHI